ncbi:MAG: hypothetical protein IJ863_00750 [Spirochaetales bacterium]|nr:hypothetical protein [Spirochaetales bacterium]
MDRRIKASIAALALVLLLASCSVVFQAGISGKVVTDEGTGTRPVSDVNVFAYTDEGLRNSDYSKFVDGRITRPSSGSGYVATTSTNANGQFTVNKVVWETKKSEFGKTADVSKLYLIFYHEDYTPAKYDATVISDSTNADNVFINLSPNKDYATININIYDISTGRAMTSACTLEYQIEGNSSSDTVVVTGNTALQIKFPKGSTPDVALSLSNPGTKWRMVDMTGIDIESHSMLYVEAGTANVDLYMKNYEFTMPGFSGNIDGAQTLYSDPSHDGSDGLPIWLEYWDVVNSSWVKFDDTVTEGNRTYKTQSIAGDNIINTHGVFSNVGNSDSCTIVVNSDNYPNITDWPSFTGKRLTVKLRIGVNNGSDVYYEFDYTVGNSRTALGKIDLT